MIKKQISAEASKVFLAAVEVETYSIPLTIRTIKTIRHYPITAEKIGCIATPVANSDDWEILLEKKYGFINNETIFEEKKQKANLEVQQLFSILAKDLMTVNKLSEDEVREVIVSNDGDNILSVYQKEVLKKLLEKASMTQNDVLENITFFISKRLHPLWNAEDTAVLPKEILDEFNYFINQEKEGWLSELEEEEAFEGERLGESSEEELKPMLTGTIAA
jgi:hypothetical protein